MAPTQQISKLKKAVSHLQSELLRKDELIDELFVQMEYQQNELNMEKHERGLVQEKYKKLQQKLAQFKADFHDVCENLRVHLKEFHVKPSSKSSSLKFMMELQIQLTNLAASLEDEENLVSSDIRKGMQKTLKQMEEVLELIDSIEDVSSTSSTTPPKLTPEQKKSKSGTWKCDICANTLSDQAILENHQKNCRVESPCTSKQLSASLRYKAGMSTSTTRATAKVTTNTVMGPPPNPKRTPANHNVNFCNLARRLAVSSSIKVGSRCLTSVIAMTVLEPTKIFGTTKHHRDITRRHNGFFCYCGIRFVSRNGLDQHRVFRIKNIKKPKKAVARPTIKIENEN